MTLCLVNAQSLQFLYSLHHPPPGGVVETTFPNDACQMTGYWKRWMEQGTAPIIVNEKGFLHPPPSFMTSKMPFSNDLWKFFGIQCPDWMEFWWRKAENSIHFNLVAYHTTHTHPHKLSIEWVNRLASYRPTDTTKKEDVISKKLPFQLEFSE